MIAGCPKCSARYRVDLGQIGEDGAKLRCTKCSAVFLVRAPQSTSPAATAAAAPEPAPTPLESSPAAAAETTPAAVPPDAHPEAAATIDPATLVLIADSVEERGKRVASAVESWGLSPILVHDGVEAMLAIQRKMPQVVVLDAALPKMFGFQICEIIKRNESLRYMNVVLVGAIHHQDRYRRNPAELYGADVYLEQPDLPDGLLPLLRDAGMSVRDAATTNSPAPSAAQPVVAETPVPPTVIEGMDAPATPQPAAPAPLQAAAPTPAAASAPAATPASAAGNSELDAERERAERLARIAVSEMLLYQPEKFDQAIRDGNIEAVLDLEIQEARALIRQRIGEDVRAEKDFILVELERVAQERSKTS